MCVILPVLNNKVTVFALECEKNKGDTKPLDNIKKQEDLISTHILLNVVLFPCTRLHFSRYFCEVHELLISIIARDSLR